MSLATNNWAQSGQRKEVKKIKNNLMRHAVLMEKFISEGMNKEEASKLAYKLIFTDC